MKRLISYILIFITLTGCNLKKLKNEYLMFNQTPSIQEGTKPQNLNRTIDTRVDYAKFEYKIQPHDRLSIVTYKHPELSTSSSGQVGASGGLGQGILVSSDGTIRLPLIDNVLVAGLTQPEAQEKIESLFREYLKRPTVQLEVLNKRAFVLGEVKRPGPIELGNEQIPLLQLISIAGDLTPKANRQSIMILKNYGDSVQTKVISLTDTNSVRSATQMIRPNDIVYVMPSDMGIFNNKVDEVNPIFQIISNALTPFLTIKLLTE
jgi:polysaccharide export outer membrane protein